MTQNIHPRINYGGPVNIKRCSSGSQHGCVRFVIGTYFINYSDARRALLRYNFDFTHKCHRRAARPIDAIRPKSTNSTSEAGKPLVIEAHFDPEVYCPFSIWQNANSLSDGYINLSFPEQYPRSPSVRVEILRTVSNQPVYYTYIVDDIPLGTASIMESDLRNAIRASIHDLYPAYDSNALGRIIVDIVPSYTSDADGKSATFCGTFTVILDASLIKFAPTVPYQLYHEQYVLDKPTGHYIYCKGCKTLDSRSRSPDTKLTA